MFSNYKETKLFSRINKQHNIIMFIGNGFDIAALCRYRTDEVVSSYTKFYDYLCFKGFNSNNILFKK